MAVTEINSEDRLVQQTFAEHLRDALGWVGVFIEGTNCHEIVGPETGVLRLANPSGVLPVTTEVRREGDAWQVDRVTVTRTARALMEGAILLPEGALLSGPATLEPSEAEETLS